jgi:hypothetical protein
LPLVFPMYSLCFLWSPLFCFFNDILFVGPLCANYTLHVFDVPYLYSPLCFATPCLSAFSFISVREVAHVFFAGECVTPLAPQFVFFNETFRFTHLFPPPLVKPNIINCQFFFPFSINNGELSTNIQNDMKRI